MIGAFVGFLTGSYSLLGFMALTGLIEEDGLNLFLLRRQEFLLGGFLSQFCLEKIGLIDDMRVFFCMAVAWSNID